MGLYPCFRYLCTGRTNCWGTYCSQACEDTDSEARAEAAAAHNRSEYAYPEDPS